MKFDNLKDITDFYNNPLVCNPHQTHIAAILILTEKLRDQDAVLDDIYTQLGSLTEMINILMDRVQLLELWIDNPEAMEWGKNFESMVNRKLPENLIDKPLLHNRKKNHKKKSGDDD